VAQQEPFLQVVVQYLLWLVRHDLFTSDIPSQCGKVSQSGDDEIYLETFFSGKNYSLVLFVHSVVSVSSVSE
jgi:hypothetical protein